MTRLLVAAAILILSLQSAGATDGKKPRVACKSDVIKNCSGIAPGEGRVLCCLKQHEATLEQACKDSLSPSKLYQKLSADCTTSGSNRPAGAPAGTSDAAAGL